MPRNLQNMLNMMIRLTFYEGNMTVSINADGTATVALRSDNLIGDAPITRDISSSKVTDFSKLTMKVPQALAAQATRQEEVPAEQNTHDFLAVNVPSATSAKETLQDTQEEILVENEEQSVKALSQKPGDDDWTLEERAILSKATAVKEEVFLYRKPGDKCSRCNVIKCSNCPFMHEEGRCYATNRECFYCGGIGHYRTKCPANKGVNKN